MSATMLPTTAKTSKVATIGSHQPEAWQIISCMVEEQGWQLVDPSTGPANISSGLDAGMNFLLMCRCRDWQHCHRKQENEEVSVDAVPFTNQEEQRV